MNFNPFIDLINNIISLYSFALMIWLILSWLIRFEVINSYQTFVRQLMNLGNRLFEPLLLQIRKIIPSMLGIDLSPILLLLLLNFTKEFLYTYLYKF
jgi:YggT family protein